MASLFNLKKQLAECKQKIKDNLEQLDVGIASGHFVDKNELGETTQSIEEVDLNGEIVKAEGTKLIMDAAINLSKNEEKKRRLTAQVIHITSHDNMNNWNYCCTDR